jgi:WD40 repeat protein
MFQEPISVLGTPTTSIQVAEMLCVCACVCVFSSPSVLTYSSQFRRLAIGGEDCDIQHFNGVPFKWEKRVENKATRMVNAIKYSPDGERYACGSSDKLIQLYDGKTGDRVGELPVEHDGSVFSLSWTDDGSKLLSASGDRTCKLWDVAAQKCISTFKFGEETEDQQVGTLCQGKFTLSVSLSGHINYLDLNNPNKPTRVLYGHQKFITALAHSPATKEFYTGSYDSVITRWNEATGESRTFTGKGHTSQINGIAAQAGNLVTASTDSTVRITSLSTMDYATSFGTDTDAVGVAVGTKDISLVFGACLDGIIRVSSGGSVQKQTHKTKLPFTVTCIALSPDERHLAVGGVDKDVHIFAVSEEDLKEVQCLKGHRGNVTCVTFSPNGESLASCDQGRDIYIWSTKDWSVVTKQWGSYHTASITCLAWHANSDNIASGGLDQNIFVWQLSKKTRKIKVERAHQGGVNALVWTGPSVLASVGNDNALKTFNITL